MKNIIFLGRYVDDILCIGDNNIKDMVKCMYPNCLPLSFSYDNT